MSNYKLLYHYKHFNVCTQPYPKILQYIFFLSYCAYKKKAVSANTLRDRYLKSTLQHVSKNTTIIDLGIQNATLLTRKPITEPHADIIKLNSHNKNPFPYNKF
jgi:hypothetical protein